MFRCRIYIILSMICLVLIYSLYMSYCTMTTQKEKESTQCRCPDCGCSVNPLEEHTDKLEIILTQNGMERRTNITGYIPKVFEELFPKPTIRSNQVLNVSDSGKAVSGANTYVAPKLPPNGNTYVAPRALPKGDTYVASKAIPTGNTYVAPKNSTLPKLYVLPLGRLGNCIYVVISGYALAKDSNHQLVLESGFAHFITIFPHLNVSYEIIPEDTPRIHEESYASFIPDLPGKLFDKDVVIAGYLQSYLYSQNYTQELRRLFRFTTSILFVARGMLDSAAELGHGLYGSDKDLTFVGVHIRRGDILNATNTELGYMVADLTYILKAMYYFRYKYAHVVFIICSDDIKWSQENIGEPDVWFQNSKHADYIDLALLNLCNHTIMTVGTFGWIAGWMAGGEVTYFEPSVDYSKPVGKRFCARDYYPPHWIPLSVYDMEAVQGLADGQIAHVFNRLCATESIQPSNITSENGSLTSAG